MTNQSIALFDAVKNTTGGESLKMTSLELADVTNKRHDNVKRTIETLVESGAIVQPQIEDEQSTDSMGRPRTTEVYVFAGPQGRLDSITVVAQLDPAFTAALVKRWDALETGKAKPAMAQPQQAIESDKPDPQAFAVVQSAWVDAVHHKIASKREALQFLRDASAVMIHGVEVLQRAAKASKPTKALPAPEQRQLHPEGTVSHFCRSSDTQTARHLLKEYGAGITAKALHDRLEREGMMVTRYYKQGGVPTAYRVLIGDGLRYGQNVLHDDHSHSHPYYYVGKFDALVAWLL